MNALLRKAQDRILPRTPDWVQLLAARLQAPRAPVKPDIVTFDAFDTLVTRPVFQPSDVFLLCGLILQQRGLSTLDPKAWNSLRQKAERAARDEAGADEVSLDDIYRHIRKLSVAALDLQAARQLEIELEVGLSRPIDRSLAAFRQASPSARKGILSDTYLPKNVVEDILRSSGVELGGIDVVASCEVQDTKRSGRLFPAYRKSIGLPSGSHVHVGDNLYSDVYQASLNGCAPTPFTAGSHSHVERAVAESDIEPPILRSAIAGSIRSARLGVPTRNDHQQAVAEVGASLVGPLLLAYVAWVIRRSVEAGLSRIYFLARDGQILLGIAERLLKESGLSLEVRYLYVSRQSLHLPAIVDLDGEDLKSLGFLPHFNILDALAKLELTLDSGLGALLRSAGYSGPLDRTELGETHLSELVQALRSPAILDLIRQNAKVRREALLKYLEQEDFFKPGRVGIVDIGWKGRLQRSICRASIDVDPELPQRLHGFYFGVYQRPADSGILESYVEQPEASGIGPVVRGGLFEVFCMANHGTTRFYRQADNGRVEPVLASQDNPAADQWGLEFQQSAVLRFTEDLLSVSRLAGFELWRQGEALAKAALICAQLVVVRPTMRQAAALGSFPHDSDKATGHMLEIAPPLPLSISEWRNRIERRRTEPLISSWPEGSVRRSVLGSAGMILLKASSSLRALRRR